MVVEYLSQRRKKTISGIRMKNSNFESYFGKMLLTWVTLLPGAKLPLVSPAGVAKKSDTTLITSIAPKSMVRTDCKEQKLDKFLVDTSKTSFKLDSTMDLERPRRMISQELAPTPKITKRNISLDVA